MKKVAFVFADGRMRRLDGIEPYPTEFFYGALEMRARGIGVGIFEAPRRRMVVAGLLDRMWGYRLPVRFSFTEYLRMRWLLPRLNEYDVVVAAHSQAGMALSVHRLTRRLEPPVVTIHCGMVNYEQSPPRVAKTRRLLEMQVSALFADVEARRMREVYGLPEELVHVCGFGVDVNFWNPSNGTREDFVLAVGNDARRDYATLVEAASKMDCRVKILTSRQLPERLPQNVEVLRGKWADGGVTDEDLRGLYRKCRCVVTALEDTDQPSGQSVTLQAMACGTPVVLTRTRGCWFGSEVKDGDHLLFVPVKNADAIAAAVKKIGSHKNFAQTLGAQGAQLVAKHYTIEQMSRRLEDVASATLDNGAGGNSK